ncbi:hypothetical protein EC973_006602, partial [Apophysomyces ossiformis]
MLNNQYITLSEARATCIAFSKTNGFAVTTIRSNEWTVLLGCIHYGDPRDTSEQAPQKMASCPIIVDESGADISPVTKKNRVKTSKKLRCPFFIRLRRRDNSWVVAEMYEGEPAHNHRIASDVYSYAFHWRMDPTLHDIAVKMLKAGSTNAAVCNFLNASDSGINLKDMANLRQVIFNNDPENAMMQLI